MTWAPSSPLTGAAQTGLTSPTYTLALDSAPETNGKMYVVTAIGGTQSGVVSHSSSKPFSLLFVRPKVMKTLGQINSMTGLYQPRGDNSYLIITKKAVTINGTTDQWMIARATTKIDVPVGADATDQAGLRAMMSLHVGAVWDQSANLGNTIITGVMG